MSELLSCRPKSLPAELHIQAAQVATAINPVNAPRNPQILAPQHIALLTSKYWGPNARRLSIAFMDKTPVDLRRRIMLHMNAWNATANFRFYYVANPANAQIRISRSADGYWSYLGTDNLLIDKTQQTMNLQDFSMQTPDSEFHRVVRHETGHVLGFPHEHMRKELVSRIDPVKAYPYFLKYDGWDQQTVDQQVLTPLDDALLTSTATDQLSIMCYQLPGEITKDGQPIIGGLDIDKTDYAFAGRVYPKPGAKPITTLQDVSA